VIASFFYYMARFKKPLPQKQRFFFSKINHRKPEMIYNTIFTLDKKYQLLAR